jgi:hypothetical protein
LRECFLSFELFFHLLTKCILFNFFSCSIHIPLPLILSSLLCIAHTQPFSCQLETAHERICGCNSLAQSSVYSSSSLSSLSLSSHPFLPSFSRFLSTFHSLLPLRSSSAAPHRASSFRTIPWPMPILVSPHIPDQISSGSLPVLVSRGPTGCRAPPVV